MHSEKKRRTGLEGGDKSSGKTCEVTSGVPGRARGLLQAISSCARQRATAAPPPPSIDIAGGGRWRQQHGGGRSSSSPAGSLYVSSSLSRTCTTPGSREAGRRASPSVRRHLRLRAGSCIAIIKRRAIIELGTKAVSKASTTAQCRLYMQSFMLPPLAAVGGAKQQGGGGLRDILPTWMWVRWLRTTRCAEGRRPAGHPPRRSTLTNWPVSLSVSGGRPRRARRR
jgi:hypothetical protein